VELAALDIAHLGQRRVADDLLEARKEVARLGALIAATGDPEERARLSGLRADAELRYRLLVEGRQR
jgi:hypothetical protein